MKVMTDDKSIVEQSSKQYIKDINYSIFKENSTLTSALVNLSLQFNSVLSVMLNLEGKNYYYNRINVIYIIK